MYIKPQAVTLLKREIWAAIALTALRTDAEPAAGAERVAVLLHAPAQQASSVL